MWQYGEEASVVDVWDALARVLERLGSTAANYYPQPVLNPQLEHV